MFVLRPATTRTRRRLSAAAGFVALTLAASGCTFHVGKSDKAADQTHDTTDKPSASASPSASPTPSVAPVSEVSTASNIVHRDGVKVDKVITLTAKKGTFRTVKVTTGKTPLPGKLSGDKSRWTSTGTLEPGLHYTVHTVAVDAHGLRKVKNSTFRTEALTKDEQTYPSFVPVQGQTVGIGMPVMIHFDRPVTDEKAIEKHLSVSNTSHQKGAWHWISNYEVHWRPVHFWKPGTDVTVKADINSVSAGNGIYGQMDRSETFHVGRSVISRVSATTHQMRTFIDGRLVKTTPITTGKPGFDTRSGIKVIIEKFRHKRMDSETIGIAHDNPNGYDLDDVEYAMRVTYSGEFLHAAPWSVGSQGYANVSHGCTGMSTSNAAWLYANSKPGDVVIYTGTNKPMTLDNGYGDWNESFATYSHSGTAAG